METYKLVDPIIAFDNFIGKFVKPESKQPPRITDEDKRRDNCQKQVHTNMSLNAVGKAYTVIKNYFENIDC